MWPVCVARGCQLCDPKPFYAVLAGTARGTTRPMRLYTSTAPSSLHCGRGQTRAEQCSHSGGQTHVVEDVEVLNSGIPTEVGRVGRAIVFRSHDGNYALSCAGLGCFF